MQKHVHALTLTPFICTCKLILRHIWSHKPSRHAHSALIPRYTYLYSTLVFTQDTYSPAFRKYGKQTFKCIPTQTHPATIHPPTGSQLASDFTHPTSDHAITYDYILRHIPTYAVKHTLHTLTHTYTHTLEVYIRRLMTLLCLLQPSFLC